MEPEYITKRITELRLKKGIAEHRMSLELGHSRSYMQSISSGRALPSLTEFLAICDYLNVSPKDFFDEENPNPVLIEEIMEKLKNLSDSDLTIILTMINRLQP
jgi:transcriptional regulator with XRE-family HTH domain